MSTVVTYQNIYAQAVAFPVIYTILLVLVSIALISFGSLLIIGDEEVKFTNPYT